MSSNAKIIIWVIVVVVVIGGVWWWLAASQTAVSPTQQTQNSGVGTNPTAQTNPAGGQTSGVAAMATGSSDAAIGSNLGNIDSQMNGFASDNANVNQGMNDQPVQQSQL